MKNQKQVKIISFKSSKFGIFNALELDFEKFKNGIIAIKGKSGEGKSTAQKAIKTTAQGRYALADDDQYGEAWENEIQLLDGERKIFISAKKKKGNSPKFTLFEKDSEGKKVQTPIIDGVKATPAKYMDIISTELTFLIKDFLSENETTHRKLMFSLFRPELEKVGVIFDKNDLNYEKSIMGVLDALTDTRDSLRHKCQHDGAYAADFKRDGYDLDTLEAMQAVNVKELEKEREDLLISKGSAESDANLKFEQAKAEVTKKAVAVVERCRVINEELGSKYTSAKSRFDLMHSEKRKNKTSLGAIYDELGLLPFVTGSEGSIFGLKRDFETFTNALNSAYVEFYKDMEEPKMISCPTISNGTVTIDENTIYEPEYNSIIADRRNIIAEFNLLKPESVDTEATEMKIVTLEGKIEVAKVNNRLIERFNTNREWVEACGEVEVKRKELSKLYAGVQTGVPGLFMKPFYNEDGKMSIKTVYTGDYSPEYFKNTGNDDRLVVSYSSTQKPIIGILLQIARLKLKSKALNYIFLDDVPMDKTSQGIIAKIAEENNLTILTSITGDFTKENLTENEMLIEGGEVFFN